MKNTNEFKVKGINSDADFCECCGKSGLKRVVWVENVETNDIKHFGVVCAQNPKKGFDQNEVKEAIKTFKKEMENKIHTAHFNYKNQGGKWDYMTGESKNPEMWEKCKKEAGVN